MINVKEKNVKRQKSMAWLKLLALGVGGYLLVVFGRGTLEIKQAYLRLNEAKEQLRREEAKKNELSQKKVGMESADYIERVARNDLNMQKEGETVVVMPASQLAVSSDQPDQEEIRSEPNWKKWWSLIK